MSICDCDIFLWLFFVIGLFMFIVPILWALLLLIDYFFPEKRTGNDE